jgi:hephaestin
MDENKTHYIEAERAKLAQPPAANDEGFVESNLTHSINGYVYGNGPVITMREGERVRWYLMGMGTEVDLHTLHWHGNTVTMAGMRMDVVNLLPASMVTADMVPDAPGAWLFHCHVNDHVTAGMQTRYPVLAAR